MTDRPTSAPQPVALTTDQLIALCAHGAEKTGGLPHDELDLRIFARAVIAEFCRINGIGAPHD